MPGKKSGPPPKSTTPYRILGEVPWGGREECQVLGGAKIPAESCPMILAECVKLMRTAEAAAQLPKDARLTDAIPSSPINPFDLERGIRNMEGGYTVNLWISPLDVMLYACRVVDRLLVELEIRTGPRAGGYPTNGLKMRDCVREVAAEVERAAAAAGTAI